MELLQDLERVTVGLHEVPGLLHLAVGADEERRADHALAPTWPLAPCAVGVVDRTIGVTHRIEIQPVLLLEGLVRPRIVLRHAEHRNAKGPELHEVVVELTRLGRAARRVVLWIEVEEIRLALE